MTQWTVTISAGDATLWSASIEAASTQAAKDRALALMSAGGGRRPKGGSTGAAGEIVVRVHEAPAPIADEPKVRQRADLPA